jgi:hypothetical protein
MVVLQPGVLVSSDEATVIYLLHWNDQQRGANRFVLAQLDSKTLFVKQDKVKLVNAILAHRLNETVFNDDEESLAAAVAAAAAAAAPEEEAIEAPLSAGGGGGGLAAAAKGSSGAGSGGPLSRR